MNLINNDTANDWVAFAGELGSELVINCTWSQTEQIDEFNEQFDMVGDFLADEDFYQGINKMTVIKRKSDGKLFGFQWFDDISKHGDSYYDSNGDEYELDDIIDDEGDHHYWYVFTPVETFTITGYKRK